MRLVWLESPPLAGDEGWVMASGDEDGLFASLPEQSAPERAGGGLPRLRFAERDQIAWRPVSLDGLLADDHRVRLVWRFVEGLDLTPLHATIKAVDGRPGHPSADPRILLALWLYATVKGIGSAREVARLCAEHSAFQWLCGGVGMNAKTLADFRVAEKALADLRAQVNADPGAASRRQAAARQRAAEDRERRVRAALAVSEELHVHQQEQARLEASRAMKKAQQEAARNNKPEAEAPASKKPRVSEPRASTTDAQARVMKMADGGFRPAYNVQFATDTKSMAIAAVSVDTIGS